MTRHPDAGALAEFREGLLGRRRSARIRAHLSGCPHCASLDTGLAEVSTLLASAPAPSIPDHLVARLDSALAAEAASRRPSDDAAPAAPANGAAGLAPDGAARQADRDPSHGPGNGWHPTRRPARSRRPVRRRPAVLGAAAAALVVLGGAAYGLASLGQHSGGTNASSGSAPQQPGKSRSGSGVVNPPAGANISRVTPLHVIHSGTDYQPGKLASQAQTALTSHGTSHAGMAQRAAIPPTGELRSCVMNITHGTQPGLVDMARYRGQQATIIVTASSAGHPAQVWVVGPACSGRQRDVLAQASLPGPG